MSFSGDVLKLQEQYQHLNMYERCLGLKYKHKLLQIDGSASVHQTNIQVLATKTYKV